MKYTNGKDIYVWLEWDRNGLKEVALELLGEAKRLIKTRTFNYEVVGVLMGTNETLAHEAVHYGADRVIHVNSEYLDAYDTLLYTDAFEQVIKENCPQILLIGGTPNGRDLAPRISARVNTGLTADATHLTFDEEREDVPALWMTRPAFGGNLYATITCLNDVPQMSTIRPGVFDTPLYDSARTGRIHSVVYEGRTHSQVHVLNRQTIQKNQEDITKAHLIISAGRGVQTSLDIVCDIAHLMHGQVAASRAIIDQGLLSKEVQVGQTGKTVKPSLYLACGISGAVQHTAGMENSECVIAINKDEKAPIFNVADYGFVGDALEILPEVYRLLKAE